MYWVEERKCFQDGIRIFYLHGADMMHIIKVWGGLFGKASQEPDTVRHEGLEEGIARVACQSRKN